MEIQYEATIEGRTYEDEDYPKLDSIRLNLRGFYIENNKVITNTIIKRQRGFKIAPNVSFGYGLTTKKMDAYVGIGITYNF